jgi:hypothetical protein
MEAIRLPAMPLPATLEEMLARRPATASRTLNDYVDDIHKQLWSAVDDKDAAEYRRLLDAVYDEDAVEGSLAIDNAKAAEIIRVRATKAKLDYVANKKLMTLVKAMNVVLRRYHMTRKERATRLGGEDIPSA